MSCVMCYEVECVSVCLCGTVDCYVLFYLCSSDVGQREQEKARLEKQYQESDRRLDNLIQGSVCL